MRKPCVVLLLFLTTAACAGPTALPPEPVQCVPYARHVSGIRLYGDAWTWWEAAAGRYRRSPHPDRGAVLVLRRTARLKHGHVAVVNAVLDRRQVDLTHANWGHDGKTRGRVHPSMRAVDVSPGNDWTEVRFWNDQAQAFGRIYEAHGFILPSAAPEPRDDQPGAGARQATPSSAAMASSQRSTRLRFTPRS